MNSPGFGAVVNQSLFVSNDPLYFLPECCRLGPFLQAISPRSEAPRSADQHDHGQRNGDSFNNSRPQGANLCLQKLSGKLLWPVQLHPQRKKRAKRGCRSALLRQKKPPVSNSKRGCNLLVSLVSKLKWKTYEEKPTPNIRQCFT